jgi:hypothetical protein
MTCELSSNCCVDREEQQKEEKRIEFFLDKRRDERGSAKPNRSIPHIPAINQTRGDA